MCGGRDGRRIVASLLFLLESTRGSCGTSPTSTQIRVPMRYEASFALNRRALFGSGECGAREVPWDMFLDINFDKAENSLGTYGTLPSCHPERSARGQTKKAMSTSTRSQLHQFDKRIITRFPLPRIPRCMLIPGKPRAIEE